MRHALVPALVLLAGCTCPFAGGIQHPDLKPEKGSYAEPVAALGTMPATTWSETTVQSAVKNKDGVQMPRKGVISTLVGEVIDVSCYVQLGKHGAAHKDCGQKCVREGGPIGLLTQDGSIFLLMAEEHHPRRDGNENLRKAFVEYMAQVVKVTGTVSTLHGQKVLFVSGYAK